MAHREIAPRNNRRFFLVILNSTANDEFNNNHKRTAATYQCAYHFIDAAYSFTTKNNKDLQKKTDQRYIKH